MIFKFLQKNCKSLNYTRKIKKMFPERNFQMTKMFPERNFQWTLHTSHKKDDPKKDFGGFL